MPKNISYRIRAAAILLALTSAAFAAANQSDPRLQKAYRFQQGGWTYVHLEGSPSDIGFQHGYLLAPEIADAFEAIKLFDTHQSQRDWEFYRTTARQMLWPKIDREYQEELQGIADGLEVQKTKIDLDDLVAMNAFQELPDYYVPWLNEQVKTSKGKQRTVSGLSGAVASINNTKVLMYLVAAIIIAALMYVSALQRVRDFAVLKALGSSTLTLFGSLALQSVMVSLLAAAFAAVACNFMDGLFQQQVSIPPDTFVALPVVAVVVGLLSSLVALRQVTGADPAAAFG